jgi:hypothetical protein
MIGSVASWGFPGQEGEATPKLKSVPLHRMPTKLALA